MLNLLFGKPGSLAQHGEGNWTTLGGMGRIGRMKTLAGPVVDEDLSLTYAAVWSCSRLLTEALAGLPRHLYQRNGNDRTLAVDHPLYDVLHARPNDQTGDMPFWQGRALHQINWGNGFAEIERNRLGQVVNLHPIHVTRVLPPRPEDTQRRIAYRVLNNRNEAVDLADREMLHIPGTMSEDGRWGKGVIQYARESVGFGLATERHGAAYFGSGAQPKGLVTAAGMKDREKRREFRKEFKEVHGSPDSNEIVIMPLESKFTPITISNEDSQYLETRKHNGIVVCQWYRTPPTMVGLLDKATLNNVEHLSIDFVTYSLIPWVRLIESQCNLKLLSPEDPREFYIELNLSGLLRGDVKTRMDAYMQAIQNGIMSINEVRRLENLNGIGPAGDQHFVQLNMTTAERMAQEENPRKVNATSVAAGDLAALLRGPDTRQAAQARALLGDVLARMFRKEANAVRRAIKNVELDFGAWLARFGAKHSATVERAIAPVCGAYPELVDACEIAKYSCAESRRQLLAAYDTDTPEAMAARLDGWAEHRTAETLTHYLGDC